MLYRNQYTIWYNIGWRGINIGAMSVSTNSRDNTMLMQFQHHLVLKIHSMYYKEK